MGNKLRDIFEGENKNLNKLIVENINKSRKERSCYTCTFKTEEYMGYFNEVGIGCELNKKTTPLFKVNKNCKYYQEENKN